MARRPRRLYLLGPKILVFSSLCKVIMRANNNKKGIAKRKDGAGRADHIPIPSHPKVIPFVPPKLDSNKLIIEEIEMGFLSNKKAEVGSKVSVTCVYKTSENDQNPQKINHEFVLGTSGVMEGLHEGICGMCVKDKRRLRIPPSLW